MGKYFADVRFNTIEFEAVDEKDADNKIRKFLDELVVVETSIGWDDINWDVYKEGDY